MKKLLMLICLFFIVSCGGKDHEQTVAPVDHFAPYREWSFEVYDVERRVRQNRDDYFMVYVRTPRIHENLTSDSFNGRITPNNGVPHLTYSHKTDRHFIYKGATSNLEECKITFKINHFTSGGGYYREESVYSMTDYKGRVTTYYLD